MTTEGFLCHECIGDEYLKRQIKRRHKAQVCLGCGKRRRAIALEELGIALDEVLRSNYVKLEGSPWGTGEELNSVVQEILGAEPEIADLVIEAAREQEDSYTIVKDGGTPFYEDSAEYEETPATEGEYASTWQMFCHNVKHTSRFFSENGAARLRDIFKGLDRFQDRDRRKPIRLLSPNESLNIYRARLAESGAAAGPIVAFPARRLGPPPAQAAIPGRMNPAGISVFYGGLDIETCVAEIRPPVGSLVVIGTFALLKPMHVLDLTVLDKAYADLSYFQPDFEQITEQLTFLHSFHAAISSIVLPSDQALGFIPTQVVAEFLANLHEPKVDGLLYASSQTGGDGLNVVLFHHASLVEGADIEERAEIRWSGGWTEDDEETLVISEDETPAKVPPRRSADVDFESSLYSPQSDILREPSLRVVPGSVKILRVTGTKYTHDKVSIIDFRGRQRDKETDDF